MAETFEVWKGQKKLKMGYTTGSCAAAASKAAAAMLLSGEEVKQVSLMTPKGIELFLDVECIHRTQHSVRCAIKKDAGDDPDVTHGILIFSEVSFCDGSDVVIDGGEGVGRVTKPGLWQAVGEAAINRVPRQMIQEAVEEERERYQCFRGISVVISIPEGKELAKKTFNPRLGIVGGISVLGTSGIVEPMSEKALLETIRLEMNMLKENGHLWCYVVPGNYGSDFLEREFGYRGNLAVKCSNYVGETIDFAVQLGMQGILMIGHIGKFVKLAAGIMNTHSHEADARMEVFASHAAMAGASRETVCKIMECITTTEAVEILKKEGILKETMQTIMKKISFYLKARAGETLKIGAIVFSVEDGILGMTEEAKEIYKNIKETIE